MTRRRLLLPLISLAASLGAFALSNAADAQQPASPRRIGVLLVAFSPESKMAQAFREGLRDAGYVEGRDAIVEWRYANGDYAKVPALAAELVQRKDDVIVAESTIAAQALKRATSTIPIVMALVSDPVGSGLITSLAHPEGNVTGLSSMSIEHSAKRLQLLKETIPKLTRVAVLWSPDMPFHPRVIEQLKSVAPSLSIELSFVAARTPEEMDPAFLAVSRARAQALYIIEGGLFYAQRTTLLKLASKARLAAIYGERGYVDEGGLMSYGANVGDLYRRSAGYVAKILEGAKPTELPVEQPTKFELVINLKTAKALGITIPESILLRADEVIR